MEIKDKDKHIVYHKDGEYRTCICCRTRKTRRLVSVVGLPLQPVCKGCLPRFNKQCNTCGKLSQVDTGMFKNKDGSFTCTWCAPHRHMCSTCNREAVRSVGGYHFCAAHAESQIFKCAECNTDHFIGHRSYHMPTVCNNCFERKYQVVKSACCKDFRSPIGKGVLFFGVELETEVDERQSYHSVAKAVHDLVGEFCVLKSDGSLVQGIEIVSCPCTFDVHQTIWEPLFLKKPNGLRSWSSGRCGIHIHISRRALSLQQLGRMLVLVNAPENDRMITAIAGRGRGQYCARSKKTLESAHSHLSKYEALNTCHDQTVELRIFRGTLNYKSFLKNIEFAHALVKFCADSNKMTQEDCEAPTKFLAWVTENKGTYPRLFVWLIKKGFISKTEDVPAAELAEVDVEV